ncbi:ROK family transcriptional regulator [Devosia sp.]|uniref:ROK family transcriptional regulator n=1 Tax=Devosia sp. TaxID=1871048 RepID=UPI002EF5B1B2
MDKGVGDSDSVRRQNRALVLEALRAAGSLARTQLAAATGLSHASITAITQAMIAQGVLADRPGPRGDQRAPGRPAVQIGFNRAAAYVVLVELEVNRARLSLVDYGGTLVDRIEAPLTPASFRELPAARMLVERIGQLRQRDPAETARLRRIAISVQGILDKSGSSLAWSPVPGLAGADLVTPLRDTFGVPVTLSKRGRLLAEGTRRLDPSLGDASIATVFLGSTVAMGLSAPGRWLGRGEEGATEFGHMNHVPNGALCRCGMRGCIEAYAADYGILRTAFSVPETTPPAAAIPAAEFDHLISRGMNGDRAATHGFNLAGRAIGYGLSRLLALFAPSHVVIVGPGTRAFALMRAEIDLALAGSLVGRISGLPQLRTLSDESEPVFKGLVAETLRQLDETEIAALPAIVP